MKRIILISCIAILYTVSCFAQKKDGFVSLFNGKDLANWTLNKEGGFEVVDGELITKSSGNGFDIYTTKWYGNYIFRFEFLLSERGNSGVFIRCTPADQYPSAGVEIQLLAPWTPWRDDLHCTGSMYGHVAVTNRPDETTGIWHKMEIKCDRSIITISVDDKVATMANVDTVKTLADMPFFGAVGFQGSHTNKPNQFAKFRNISIRDFDAEPDYVLKGFYDENEKRRVLAMEAAVNLGATMIQPLTRLISDDNPVAKSCARQALFDIVAKASDSQTSEKGKKEVAAALKKSIKNASVDTAKDHLKWLSGMIKN
ncbi:MAG: DUF1080 domain-containing protein [Prolixibacteraceae bacterium]|jgi:hypothetical protein|nr:DUF1080 domain-containing protein [Prolixibacteraceae bacterium]